MNDVRDSDLVQMSRNLLESVIDSSEILSMDTMGPDEMQRAKIVLGFLNAASGAVNSRMQFFQMTDIEGKYAAVKSQQAHIKALK